MIKSELTFFQMQDRRSARQSVEFCKKSQFCKTTKTFDGIYIVSFATRKFILTVVMCPNKINHTLSSRRCELPNLPVSCPSSSFEQFGMNVFTLVLASQKQEFVNRSSPLFQRIHEHRSKYHQFQILHILRLNNFVQL